MLRRVWDRAAKEGVEDGVGGGAVEEGEEGEGERRVVRVWKRADAKEGWEGGGGVKGWGEWDGD